MGAVAKAPVKVSDEVWIIVALLHRENPGRSDFTVQEIVRRAEKERVVEVLRPGVYVHALQHCVANRPPNPGRYCMLFESGGMTRRLWRPGDPVHPGRAGAKSAPRKDEIPESYRVLLDWYQQVYARRTRSRPAPDPLLALRGLGKEIWKGVDPDEYVRKLREDWK